MTEIHKLYTKEIYGNLRYRSTWLPGTPIRLGSVGPIEDGIFRPVTDLNRLGIQFEEAIDTDQDTIDFTSSNGVTIAFKAGGESNAQFKSLAKIEAGALVEFSKRGAVVLQLRDVSLNRISDQARLRRDLLQAVVSGDESRQWLREWTVVTEVARAGSATILISGSSNSLLELRASGSAAPTSLVDASAKLSVAAESELSNKVIAQAGLTPLYRGLRVKPGWFWLYDEILPASSEAPPPDEVFGEADPDGDD